MIMHEAERAAWEDIGRCIQVARVFGADSKGCMCEAMGGDVWSCGREDGAFERGEGPGGGWVVVGVVEVVRGWF